MFRIKFPDILKSVMFFSAWLKYKEESFPHVPILYNKCCGNVECMIGVLEILSHTDFSENVSHWTPFQAVGHWTLSKSSNMQRCHTTGKGASSIHFVERNIGGKMM